MPFAIPKQVKKICSEFPDKDGDESYNFPMSEKWEYQVIQNMAITGGNKKLVPELNTLGQDGWEAVSVGAKASGAIEYVLLKRRIL